MPMSPMPWASLKDTSKETGEELKDLTGFIEPRSVFLVPSSQVTIALIAFCSTTRTLEELTTHAASAGSH